MDPSLLEQPFKANLEPIRYSRYSLSPLIFSSTFPPPPPAFRGMQSRHRNYTFFLGALSEYRRSSPTESSIPMTFKHQITSVLCYWVILTRCVQYLPRNLTLFPKNFPKDFPSRANSYCIANLLPKSQTHFVPV
jgi:hypothetical protein